MAITSIKYDQWKQAHPDTDDSVFNDSYFTNYPRFRGLVAKCYEIIEGVEKEIQWEPYNLPLCPGCNGEKQTCATSICLYAITLFHQVKMGLIKPTDLPS